MMKGLVVSGVTITIGDNFNSFGLITMYFDIPLELTDKLKYSGPADKSVKTRKIHAKALS